MKHLLVIPYPIPGTSWMLGLTYATNIARGNGTRSELWVNFRWWWEHTSHFHRLRIPLSKIK